jgi:hypothetical protein
MTDPAYRRRLQQLADFVVATLPSVWQEATLRATFPSSVRTRLEVSYATGGDSRQVPVEIPSPMSRDFAGAARAVRNELVLAGNPECRSFVFALSKEGKSSLDVEY